MKHKTHHLYYLFYPRWWIIIVSLFCCSITNAQEQTPDEFTIEAGISKEARYDEHIMDLFDESGMNTIKQYANEDTKPRLTPYKLHALNMDSEFDRIYHYSSSYYSKWEAEEDQQDKDKVGVKHSVGKVASWNDTLCWSTKDVIGPVDTLVYGPTYHQEKWYRRWLYMSPQQMYNLKYIPRYRMALEIKGNVGLNEAVCKIYVLLKYLKIVNGQEEPIDSIYVLKDPITLYVSDFPDSGQFKYFYFGESSEEQYYMYPSGFRESESNKLIQSIIPGIYREDKRAGQGVQFCVDWLRSDTLCTLYIDNIEVYDGDGWNDYVDNPEGTANQIKAYADSFKSLGWTNIKYWMGHSEPFSLDAYTPIKTVDAIVKSAFTGAPPIMTTFYPYWETLINNDIQLERYYNTVQPEKLMIDFYPFSANYTSARY